MPCSLAFRLFITASEAKRSGRLSPQAGSSHSPKRQKIYHCRQMASSNPLIKIEDVAKMPVPGGSVPSNITFSPDGKLVTYLHSEPGKLTRNLYAFDLQAKVSCRNPSSAYRTSHYSSRSPRARANLSNRRMKEIRRRTSPWKRSFDESANVVWRQESRATSGTDGDCRCWRRHVFC